MKSESEVAQLCPTLRDPMDCSLPGSSARGIFQARVIEWGAIAFSKKQPLVVHLKKKWTWLCPNEVLFTNIEGEQNLAYEPWLETPGLDSSSSAVQCFQFLGFGYLFWLLLRCPESGLKILVVPFLHSSHLSTPQLPKYCCLCFLSWPILSLELRFLEVVEINSISHP